MSSVDDFVEKAMQLSDEERAEIAQKLLLSLERGNDDLSDEEWIAAWRPELERRIRAYEGGEASAIDWRESLARVRKAFAEPSSAYQAAWSQEILSRSDALARGELAGSDWREAMERVRR